MSICMCVPVSSSIWVNGLQYVRAPVTTEVEMYRELIDLMIRPLPQSVGDYGFTE